MVVAQSVCPEKSYAIGDGLKTATVREEATVTLHARDKDGREYEVMDLVVIHDCDYYKNGSSTVNMFTT